MLVDSHCHLDFPEFATELDSVVDRAKSAGVGTMVTISTRIANFPSLLQLAQRYEGVFCSVGTHPHNAADEQDIPPRTIVDLAENPRVVAIGEAGLDYHYDNAPRPAQISGFRNHIAAARETGLPLVIHAREADTDIAAILREETGRGPFRFVLHCFSSGRLLAETGIELGGYVSFSGIVAFKKSEELREIARDLPYDRLLVETDAPYLAPPPHRGKRNEPAFVAYTARIMAEAIGLSEENFADQTTENFFRLFTRAQTAG